MKWVVGTKIGAGFAFALAIIIAIGAAAYSGTIRLTDTADWVTHTHKVLETVTSLIQAMTDAETAQRGYAITGDETYLEPYRASLPTIPEYLKDVRFLTQDNPREQHRIDLLEPLVQQRLATLKETIDLEKARGAEAARDVVLTGRGKKEMDQVRDVVAGMKDEENGLLKMRAEEALATVHRTRVVIVAGSAAALLVLAFAGWLITRDISRPLGELTAISRRMAAGDLTAGVITIDREDEVGALARAFAEMSRSLNGTAAIAVKIAQGDLREKVQPLSERDVLGNAFARMIDTLRKNTAELTEGVNVLASSASQILAATTQVASGAAEIGTSIAETTMTVEEVKQTAQVSSQKAKNVADSAQRATQVAQTGRKAVEASLEGMKRVHAQMESVAESVVKLSEQGQAIGEIIATVNDLAEQSNLLAVNAAIEAAKAGEQGKGFAVVAQEVRSLAEQSKQATAQVRSILGDIQKATTAAVLAAEQGSKAVENGVKQSTDAGEAIRLLADSITEAAQAATQIAVSSQQQLVGTDQVASAMESIKIAGSQNVTGSKQAETAAHNLHELGQKLKQVADQYQV